MTLGQDFSADAMDAFSGELYDATLTRVTVTGYDINDPSGEPTKSTAVFECEAIAFAYEQRLIDGTKILKGDYQVVILRGSLATTPETDDMLSVPPPGGVTPVSGRVINIDAITEAFITVGVRGVPL